MWSSWRLTNILAIVALVSLGVSSLVWASLALPVFRSTGTAQELTHGIIADRRFKPSVLVQAEAGIDRHLTSNLLKASLMRAKALLALRASQEVNGGDSSETLDSAPISAGLAIRSSLGLAPGDSYLWLMLYSTELARTGFDVDLTRYLEQSYSIGPLEGWIALRRNVVALGAYSALSSDARSRVNSEFSQIVHAGFINDAAVTIEGVGWNYRDILLANISAASLESREWLARRLMLDGVQVTVPGVNIQYRPWK